MTGHPNGTGCDFGAGVVPFDGPVVGVVPAIGPESPAGFIRTKAPTAKPVINPDRAKSRTAMTIMALDDPLVLFTGGCPTCPGSICIVCNRPLPRFWYICRYLEIRDQVGESGEDGLAKAGRRLSRGAEPSTSSNSSNQKTPSSSSSPFRTSLLVYHLLLVISKYLF